MEENERYIYTKIDGYYWIKDTETNENYCVNKSIVKLLNQQDKEIKRLKEQLSNEEQLHHMCIKSFEEETEKLRKQIKFESDARERFRQENQQFKELENDNEKLKMIMGIMKNKKTEELQECRCDNCGLSLLYPIKDSEFVNDLKKEIDFLTEDNEKLREFYDKLIDDYQQLKEQLTKGKLSHEKN